MNRAFVDLISWPEKRWINHASRIGGIRYPIQLPGYQPIGRRRPGRLLKEPIRWIQSWRRNRAFIDLTSRPEGDVRYRKFPSSVSLPLITAFDNRLVNERNGIGICDLCWTLYLDDWSSSLRRARKGLSRSWWHDRRSYDDIARRSPWGAARQGWWPWSLPARCTHSQSSSRIARLLAGSRELRRPNRRSAVAAGGGGGAPCSPFECTHNSE